MEPDPSPTLNILVAPATFKECHSATGIAQKTVEFLSQQLPEEFTLTACPIADGGDDTLAVLSMTTSGFHHRVCQVKGPVPDMAVQAQYLVHPHRQVAVIEAAQANGIKLLQGSLQPMEATSFGVGEILATVIREEPDLRQIMLTVGGSASTDGGIGALQALGVGFFDQQGQLLQTPIGGEHLSDIAAIEWPEHPIWQGKEILIATDVTNPLLGTQGTARIFAPQKGATEAMIRNLEHGLAQVAQLLFHATGENYADLPGAGAAGGLAFGLKQLPGSRIIEGSGWIFEMLGLPRKVQTSNLIITGEGRLDATSLSGKATGELLKLAAGKPVLFLCGQYPRNLPLPPNLRVQVITPEGLDFQSACQQFDPLLETALLKNRDWILASSKQPIR